MQPLGPSRDHDPEKDPAELVRAWTEWPLEILLEKLSPGSPFPVPCPRAADARDAGDRVPRWVWSPGRG